jgi:zinc transport system permease protein
MEEWLDQGFSAVAQLLPPGTMLSYGFNLRALVALVFISVVCGSVGSLVVGNRMAFFSDALAHAAFAGVAFGILLAFLLRLPSEQLFHWITPVMAVFGILVGLGIFVIRERTAQSNDTVIGVFFAGSIGLGAILMTVGSKLIYFPTDEFLFGSLAGLHSTDVVLLAALVVVTGVFLYFTYNDLVFASFNLSLARSRRIPVRMQTFLFIALLAVIVNVCITAVGALLINGLLIVPAATAANVCRNMRQLFRWSIGLCLTAAVAGQWLSWEVKIPLPGSRGGLDHARLGEGGTIVVLSVVLFFVSMAIGPRLRAAPASGPQPASPAPARGEVASAPQTSIIAQDAPARRGEP